MSREERLVEAFVSLADTLTDDYDAIDFLHHLADRCVDLLAADAAGILLTDQRGNLRLAAASSEESQVLELFQLQNDEGPCLEAYHTARPVLAPNLADHTAHWPRFVAEAQSQGFASVHALPLKLRDQTMGAMNLFRIQPRSLTDADLLVGQGLADIATIGILHERAISRSEVVTEQLQNALNSRVIIEQAKGVLAQAGQITPGEAFTHLRSYTRSRNARLTQTAQALVNRALDAPTVLTAAKRGHSQR
jgi:transcriptional regulator with GAF, ATPase, and Fis domain